MTKQPPFVTKLRLSKLCRGIIALAIVKLCVLIALVADIPLPELRWEKAGIAEQNTPQNTNTAANAEGNAPQSTTLVLGTPEHSLLASRPQATAATALASAVPYGNAGSDLDSGAPDATGTSPNSQHVGADAGQGSQGSLGSRGSRAVTSAPAQITELQGSAAAAAAARLRPIVSNASVTMPVSTATRDKADSPVGAIAAAPSFAAPAQSTDAATVPINAAAVSAATGSAAATAQPESTLPLLASGVENPQQPSTENGWWQNMLQLKKLPIPHMGVSQVAHAAALDTPPSPTVAQPAGASPFTPPGQQILRGQDASGAPLPPRSTTARPLPAGSSGLPSATPPISTNSVDPMTTSVPPPAPNVNAYSPPEDPTRKQQELARREQEILALKQQMDQRLKELEDAEKRVKSMLNDASSAEAKKIANLIAVYANMKPKQAAQTLQSLDERVAVKILTGLSPKQAGEILSYADPKTTAKLTELMTRMQMQP